MKDAVVAAARAGLVSIDVTGWRQCVEAIACA